MKISVEGQKQQTSADFLSQNVFLHYDEGRPWNSEKFCFVEIGGLVPAWITIQEKNDLEELKTIDEFEKFIEKIGLEPIFSEDLLKWQQSNYSDRD